MSDSEIASFVDLELPSILSEPQKARIKREVGTLLVDHILLNVGKARSPFGQGSYQSLSKDYKKQKVNDGAGGKANLENSGDMLDSVSFSITDDGVKLFVSGDQAPKADGHNNFSGESRLPDRHFLPKEDDSFPGQVQRDVQAIIAEETVSASNIKKSDVDVIDSTRMLNLFLRTKFPSVTVTEAKNNILLDSSLRVLFSSVLRFF